MTLLLGVGIGIVIMGFLIIAEMLIIGFVEKKRSMTRQYLVEKGLLEDYKAYVKDQRLRV